MRTLVLSLVAAFAVGGIALAAPDPTPSPGASPPSPATPGAIVHMKNFAFGPDSVTLLAGQSVRFIEDDDSPHTVTATDRSFDSGNLNKGDKWDRTFPVAGTYTYICAYHPYMKGTIIVK
ncbi:MAG: copper-binding protein [Candidatus Eremiobacteraeota bacterium]|jgi:plastocyanin|nr:copper-binding protein [Candidatus Eremiobacteraeota bacterium]